jgi:glycosyltransferase involved in cell wall biosynthesis
MSVYTKEKPQNLNECLESLSTQTLLADELILVEDGPIYNELESVIEKYRTKLNIFSVCLDVNVGLAIALNEGLKHCKCELVARMDSDDVARPKRFEKQVSEFLKDKSLDILGGFAQEFSSLGVTGNTRVMPSTHEAIYTNLFSCPLIHPTVMYRKKSIIDVGAYNSDLKRRQDYELWFRCAQAGYKFKNLSEILISYRFSDDTHKRQSKRNLLQQGKIGFVGVRKLNQSLWKGVAAFYPLLRSFLPGPLEHFIYRLSKRFDPRQKALDK